MKLLKLKPQHEDTIIAKYLTLLNSINYNKLNIEPYYNNMELWQQKEYIEVNNENLKQLEMYKLTMIEYSDIFNNILSHYNTTVTLFLYSYSIN